MVAGSARVGKRSGLVPVPFPSYRPGMIEDRDGFLFDVAYVLRHKVPPSFLREIAKRGGGARDEAGAAARAVAESVLGHLLLCGWRLERPPPPPTGPAGLMVKIL
jgi:hypothetical protein